MTGPDPDSTRPDLSGVPAPPPQGESAPPPRPAEAAPPAAPSPSAVASGFDFNQPTIISLLYLSSLVFGVTAIIGVVLAYVWRNEAKAPWEASHYTYLIRTFWIGFIGTIVGFVLLVVLIGLIVLPAVAVLVVVRSVLSLINAQKQMPMPNPETLLA